MNACRGKDASVFKLCFYCYVGYSNSSTKIAVSSHLSNSVDTLPNTDLIWVQLALVHWVRVLNDFYLVLSKSLPIETLRRNAAQDLIRFW